jgi:hypothetical protein
MSDLGFRISEDALSEIRNPTSKSLSEEELGQVRKKPFFLSKSKYYCTDLRTTKSQRTQSIDLQ